VVGGFSQLTFYKYHLKFGGIGTPYASRQRDFERASTDKKLLADDHLTFTGSRACSV
jgi:hypothetical protein